jgi:nucleoside-diphosphate-sugar epimerase
MTDCASFSPVLVTGAAGFVGACVVRELLRRHYQVHVLLRNPGTAWRLVDVLDQLVVHRGNLLDEAGVRQLVHSVRPRTVFHLAAHGAYENQSDARAILQTNILGTYNLLECSCQANVALFVNTGSSSEYGFKTEPMQETDRLEPNSFYSVAKAAQTHLCSLLARRNSMAVGVFRLFSVYGPWEEPTRLVPTILRRARSGLPLQMAAPDVARDFVYVEDVLDALLDLPRMAALRGEVLNLGTGVETTLREFVGTATRLTGSSSQVCWGAMPSRHWDTKRWVADPSRAKQLLDWAPRHSLAQGLAKMISWMEEMGDRYGRAEERAAS